MASFQQSVQMLHEMFPNHRLDTIEGILQEMNGNVDNATSILLDTPVNASPPPFSNSNPQRGGYRPPPPQPQYAPPPSYQAPPPYGNGYPGPTATAQPYSPAYAPPSQVYGASPQPYGAPPQPYGAPPPQRSALPKFDHIFSNDFLRWPEDAQVVRVDRNGHPLPTPHSINLGNPPPFPVAAGRNPPAYPGGIGAIPACDPNDDLPPSQMPQIDINSELIPGVTQSKDSTSSWWENFKARFKKKDKTAQYEAIK